MWLKLTRFDGVCIRVNMSVLTGYYPHESDNGKTFIEFPVASDNMEGFHVRETIEQIDDAMNNPQSSLRLVSKW